MSINDTVCHAVFLFFLGFTVYRQKRCGVVKCVKACCSFRFNHLPTKEKREKNATLPGVQNLKALYIQVGSIYNDSTHKGVRILLDPFNDVKTLFHLSYLFRPGTLYSYTQ